MEAVTLWYSWENWIGTSSEVVMKRETVVVEKLRWIISEDRVSGWTIVQI